MTETDPTVQASLLAVALGIVKIIEAAVTWAAKRYFPGQASQQPTPVVHLSPEVSQKMFEVHGIVARTNSDGGPLVYGPRQEVKELQGAVENLESKIDFALDNLGKGK